MKNELKTAKQEIKKGIESRGWADLGTICIEIHEKYNINWTTIQNARNYFEFSPAQERFRNEYKKAC